MRSIEIRVGFENPTKYSDPRFLNTFCGFITNSSETSISNTFTNFTISTTPFINVTVPCSGGTLNGRYITIQMRDCGQLEIHEVTFLPNPRKSNLKIMITYEMNLKQQKFFPLFQNVPFRKAPSKYSRTPWFCGLMRHVCHGRNVKQEATEVCAKNG